MKKTWSLILAAVMMLSLTSCGGAAGQSMTDQSGAVQSTASQGAESVKTDDSEHEPLTIVTGNLEWKTFYEAFKKKYPEVELKFISYVGANMTDYFKMTLQNGDAPDIYMTTYTVPNELQKEFLLDLSGYQFTEKYNPSTLKPLEVDSKLYLVPSAYSLSGIQCNKTMFEKHGWKIPDSFEELEALAPKIKDAGIKMCRAQELNTGDGLTEFFRIAEPDGLYSSEGLEWVENFLAGKATAKGYLEKYLDYFQKWINLGMLTAEDAGQAGPASRQAFYNGESAFFIGTYQRSTQNEDGTGDQYAFIPFLSPDGSRNLYYTNVQRHFGLNKKLGESANSQKLEDALKFMDFISTQEGQESLGVLNNMTMSSLSDASIEKDNPLYNAWEAVRNGQSAPYMYADWQGIVSTIGGGILKWYKGELTKEDMVQIFDSAKPEVVGSCEKDFTQEETAKMLANAMAESAGADAAFISLGDFHDFDKENSYGVNGHLYKGELSDTSYYICTVNGTIGTAKMTGAQLKEIQKAGYDPYNDGNPFSYVTSVKDGKELKDNETYTVAAIFNTVERDAVLGKYGFTDTGIKSRESWLAWVKAHTPIGDDDLKGT